MGAAVVGAVVVGGAAVDDEALALSLDRAQGVSVQLRERYGGAAKEAARLEALA